jgi:hypothetical protein
VIAEDVDYDRAKQRQRKRYEAICQKHNARNELKQKNENKVMGKIEGPHVLAGEACRRWHRDEVKKPVEAEDEEDEAQ